ncbi:TlpA family protein disulfide reductase [Fulvivirga lutea]|uniref:TlpA family protein disulfide reductase n=1 Tax=Fulvivirga lutea TaxID=2810512 RepID=A0A974WIT6_9BACT|nr:TlpA disulfide reductase family protein [Fulvivirga lutea]QSE98689.1 TlpA family protein disulfide reductase [Fulvivirga lutea]
MKNFMKTSMLFLSFTFFIFFFQTNSTAQEIVFERDDSGNPILDQQFVDTVINKTKFKKIDGETLTLRDFKGKVVVIDFWQTWCGPCIIAFKGLQDAKLKYPDKLEIIAASPEWADKEGKIKRFIKKNNYSFQFIWAGELERILSLKSIPYKIIIDENGNLITTKSDSGGQKEEFLLIEKILTNHSGR